MLRLIDIKWLRGNEEYDSMIITNPAVKVHKDKHDLFITFIGDRTNIDYKLDMECTMNLKRIRNIEQALMERHDVTIAIYCGVLYMSFGYVPTDEMLDMIKEEDEDE